MAELAEVFVQTPIAHRGLHDIENGVQENSHRAFVRAMKRGYAIELDLQLSRDGEAMVFHDYDMGRLTDETGPVQQRMDADLRKTPLKIGGEPILDLGAVLHLVDGEVPILIELKDQDGALGPNVGRLEARVAEVLANYRGPIAVMSFNPHSMIVMSELAPDIVRGLTTSDFSVEMISQDRAAELRDISDFGRAKCSFISHDWRQLDSAPVARLKAQNTPVLCWTIRSKTEEEKARNIADNITFEGYLPARCTNL